MALAAEQTPAAPLIDTRGLTLTLSGQTILDGIDLALYPDEIVSLIGPNGAGKTCLVRVLLGLLKPQAGSVARTPGVRVGYLPQQLPVDPVLPLTVRRLLTLTHRSPDDRLDAALDEVGCPGRLGAQVATLSGGELRRVLLARALLRDPDLLVLDEPTAGVDFAGEAELYRLIAEIKRRRGCGILMVSHDLHLVMAATDRVICLHHHICCQGAPDAVGANPEYLRLFGRRAAASLAVYSHQHDHVHALDGHIEGAHGHGDHPPGRHP